MKSTLARIEIERQLALMASAPPGTIITATFLTSSGWRINYAVTQVGPDFLIIEKDGQPDVIEIGEIVSRIQHDYQPCEALIPSRILPEQPAPVAFAA